MWLVKLVGNLSRLTKVVSLIPQRFFSGTQKSHGQISTPNSGTTVRLDRINRILVNWVWVEKKKEEVGGERSGEIFWFFFVVEWNFMVS